MAVAFGVLSFNNNADCCLDVELMSQSFPAYPGNNIMLWKSNNIAIGQKTVSIPHEPLTNKLPLFNQSSRLAIAGDIRLDNRTELIRQLGLSPTLIDLGDADIVLEAYQKWGEHCPEYFLGDFSFVIWDDDKEMLFCSVDHFGARGLFYFYNGKEFVFASNPNPIFALKRIPKSININKLATLAFSDAQGLFGQESWFKDIYPMPSATTIIVDKHGIRKRTYWVPEAKDELSFKNEAEYAEAFQEVFFRAVGDRMRSSFPVVAQLSGGLDSSSIVAVAARILEKQNKEIQVFSAVLADADDPELHDERYFIDQFKTLPNVKINYITAPGSGFLSDLDDLNSNIYSPNLISRFYINKACLQKAREIGARVILSGGGGELGTSSYAAGGYAEMFSKLQWRHLYKELYQRKALTGESIKFNMINGVLKPLMPQFLQRLRRQRSLLDDYSSVNYIQPAFAAKLRLLVDIEAAKASERPAPIGPDHRINQVNHLRIRQLKARGTTDFDDVEFRQPLMDKRLLDFCLAAPLNYKVNNGYQRNLVRSGLNHILPPEIQWRNSKSPFSPDYFRRYTAQQPAAIAFLNAIAATDPVRSIVDVDKLKSLASMPVADNEHDSFKVNIALHVVPQGIYLIQFLRRFQEFKEK